jgi:glycine betaine/choline ABC-type transport system substrate-binding protein
MKQDETKTLGFLTLSDLAKAIHGGKAHTLVCNSEFYARPDGLRPLEKTYGFEFNHDRIKRMETAATLNPDPPGRAAIQHKFHRFTESVCNARHVRDLEDRVDELGSNNAPIAPFLV